jgi:NitT/TauT family transport system substrate-binding protein
MSGQIDIGWGAHRSAEGIGRRQIRIIANGNDVPRCAPRPCASTWSIPACWRSAGRGHALRARYRETLDWMFSSPDAVALYAEQMKCRSTRRHDARQVQTKDAMRNDRVSDLDVVMADAVTLKYLDKPLTKAQLGELIQIPK